ncbi:MAG: hypothetical protein ACKVTZ_04925 [Bacteroidia bacterium]
MMENENEKSVFEDYVLSETAREHLRVTRPWLMFSAILLFVFTGLGGLMIFFALFSRLGSLGIFEAFVSLLFLGVYFFFGWSLYQYAVGIRNAITFHDMSYLDEAFRHQKNFWIGIGIMIIITIILYLIALLSFTGGAGFW